MSWKPIETCPENETVLLWVKGAGPCVGMNRQMSDSPKGFCHLYAGSRFREKNRGATHWMQLPPPPAD